MLLLKFLKGVSLSHLGAFVYAVLLRVHYYRTGGKYNNRVAGVVFVDF